MTDYIKISTLLLVILSTVNAQMIKQNLCAKSTDTCQLLTECDFALKLINSIRDNVSTKGPIIQKLQELHCGFRGRSPLVCCSSTPSDGSIVYYQTEDTATNRPKPLTTTTPMPMTTEPSKIAVVPPSTVSELTVETASPVEPDVFPGRNICGQSISNDKIIGGSITAIDEYPWMARIKYLVQNSDGSTKTRYACSATLITDRHLVTAAHCLPRKQQAVAVSLGDWNIDSPEECYGGVCPDPPVEIEIESIVKHPAYKAPNYTFGDIAILKLKRPVTFTDFIQPICLPTTEYIKMQDYTHNSVYWTAGWGVTEFGDASMVKRKVDIEAVPMDVCRAALPYIPESSSQSLICAGGRQGKDSCSGDSGGPLMREVKENYKANWFLYGVTSFGSKRCGSAGIPGVYTRVTVYMDWIRNIVQT
ncbi:CLIP domain-containing serine protease B4 [Bicyclus anynana]|uniref:CLIP domain-containing serine protease n=1 Tax=Bicyclus anynana TaxID=110368 RepID=A0A6J1N2D8_BICAN|nr:CLIP domain-containing serine protease B4 [Bicyclus anynana]